MKWHSYPTRHLCVCVCVCVLLTMHRKPFKHFILVEDFMQQQNNVRNIRRLHFGLCTGKIIKKEEKRKKNN